MISVVVPAHNEEESIFMCLKSLATAAKHPGLFGKHVEIIVVLDACTDSTKFLAEEMGATTLDIDARNVGTARQLGAQAALNAGARWLAFTDADTCVAPDWLVAQLALKADAVCGTIAVDQWGTYGERMRRHFALTYNDRDGHSHVHGANLGVSAKAFEAVGGFQNLASGEDVALVQALSSAGAHIAWSRAPRVTTSARPTFRAPGGFGATLARIELLGDWAGAAPDPCREPPGHWARLRTTDFSQITVRMSSSAPSLRHECSSPPSRIATSPKQARGNPGPR